MGGLTLDRAAQAVLQDRILRPQAGLVTAREIGLQTTAAEKRFDRTARL